MGMFAPKAETLPMEPAKVKALDPLSGTSTAKAGRKQALTSLLGSAQTNSLASSSLLGV